MTLIVFVGVCLAIGLVGYFYLSRQMNVIRDHVHAELAAISSLKSGHVATWYSEQVRGAEFYMTVPVVAETVAALIADPTASGPRRAMSAMLEAGVRRTRCNRALLLDREQRVVLSYPDQKNWLGDRAKSFARQTLGSNTVVVSDLHRSKMEPGKVDMDVFAPLSIPDSGGGTGTTVIAVMMFEMSPEVHLYGYLKFCPKESASAESLLVRREDDDSVLYLSPLRHATNAPLTMRQSLALNPRSPAAMAVLGHEGVVEAVDYRGAPVLADVRKVRGTPWYMISMVDEAEVYAEHRHQAWNTGAMIALLLAVAALTVAFAWGRREKLFFRERLMAERDYRNLFERMSDGFAEHALICDQDGKPVDYRFLRVNQAFERQTGLRAVDIVGKTVLQVIPDLDMSWIERYGRVALTGEPIEFENYMPAMGRHYFVEAFRPAPGQFACLFTDITERKKAEESLRENEMRMRTLFEESPVGIWEEDFSDVKARFEEWSANGVTDVARFLEENPAEVARCAALVKVADMNQNSVRFFGATDQASLSRNLPDYFTKESMPAFRDELAALAGGASKFDCEMPIRTPAGVRRVFMLRLAVLSGHEEDLSRVIVSFVDISERKEMMRRQAMMVEILAHLNKAGTKRTLIGGVLAIIKREEGVDAVGIRLREGEDFPYYVQDGFSDEFVRLENRLCAYSEDGAARRDECGNRILECTCGLVLSGKTDPSNPLFTLNGSAWINNSETLLTLPENEDPRTHPRNRCIHEGYKSVALIPIRAEGSIIGLLQLNYRREGMFTADLIGFYEGVADSIGGAVTRVHAMEEVQRERDRARSYFDTAGVMMVVLNADQTVARVNLNACKVLGYKESELIGKNWFAACLPPECRTAVKEAFKRIVAGDCEPFESYENDVLTRTGERRTVAWRNVFLRDPDGRITGTLSSGEDITERIAAEKRENELQEKLNRAARMESLGVLACGVAHDLNNVLNPVIALPDLVEEYLTRQSDTGNRQHAMALEAVGVIRNSARRAAAVVNDLVVMGRRGQYQAECVDLNNVVRETLDAKQMAAWRASRPEVTITVRTAEGKVCCMGSESRILRIALNLVGNAVEAIQGHGEVRVEAGLRILSEVLRGQQDVPAGRYAVLSVADTGSGMSPETLGRIFEPFFTTKAPSERTGSGLGLSVVHGLVRDHKGYIDVESAPGAGTKFSIFFPAVEDTTLSPPAGGPKAEVKKGDERILVVDDEPAQLTVVRMVLRKAGYKVTAVESGNEAMNLMDAAKQAGQPAPFDLAILDMRMHDTDGVTLLRKMLALYPGVKAIVSSGDAPDDWSDQAVKMGADWLGKPFMAADLVRAVRKRLDRKE